MNHTYDTQVNGTFTFEVSTDDLKALDAVKQSETQYHILHGHSSYKATILQADVNNKQYQVQVNGQVYQVAIADQLDRLIKAMGFALGQAKQVNSIKAPMPGLILDIMVQAGQTVAEDDNLLILEAMKMENVITSPRAGVIKSVSVAQGDAVDKNQLLIEFE